MAREVNKEKEILSIMKDLDCTREEAEEVFELEQKARETGADKVVATSPTPKKTVKRERKEDPDKRQLIQCLFESLHSIGENTQIENPEREVTFLFNGNAYSVTLTKHRPKKN